MASLPWPEACLSDLVSVKGSNDLAKRDLCASDVIAVVDGVHLRGAWTSGQQRQSTFEHLWRIVQTAERGTIQLTTCD